MDIFSWFYIVVFPLNLLFLFSLMGWFIHRSMVLEEGIDYGYGSFKEFISQYNSMEWERDSKNRTSHFNWVGLEKKGYIHSGIVIFHGKGMVLRYPISFFRYIFWLRRNRLKKTTGKINWKEFAPPLTD